MLDPTGAPRLADDGVLIDARAAVYAAAGVTRDSQVAVYCGSGVTAAYDVFEGPS